MPNDISNRQSRRLIARKKLFGNPTFAMCRISPDGEMLSWLAPLDGVLNVWLAPRQAMQDATAITADRLSGIRQYTWSRDGRHILYMQDVGGDEDWHVYSVEISTGSTTDLSPEKGIAAHIAAMSWDAPGELIVAINDRDSAWHDFYRVNISTGERQCVLLNEQELSNVVFDRRFVARIVEQSTPDGGRTIMRYDGGIGGELYQVSHEDYLATDVTGFEADNQHFYMHTSIGRDKAALIRVDWSDGTEELLAEHDRADISQILVHPTKLTALAYGVNDLKHEWFALGTDIAGDLDFLRSELPGGFQIVSRSRAHDRWIAVASDAQSPGNINYLYDRNDQTLTRLNSSHPELEHERLAAMHPVVLPTLDGYEMVSYLSLPPDSDPQQSGRPSEPLAMVLLVHGGPWSRDGYGFNAFHLWLADRGYAVLSVNFRGSTGFGKAFINAGDLEWGRKMHDDLLEAVDWAVSNGIADRDKVAIMGGSYGGYAALVGLAFTPDKFACGVDIVGPSNLETLLATVPPYWQAFFENLTRRVGDPRTEKGRALLRERSPLYKADQIIRPLLIGQGANDPRVKQAESDQIVSAMQAKALPVVYALYPDEGHGFARPENRLSFYALTEAFLGAHLGGSVEPLGESLTGTSLDVRAGADLIAGLDEALAKLATQSQ